jgi:hypothetical protein
MAFAATASKRGAVANMDKAAVDVAGTLARLSEMTLFELRGEWRRLHRAPPPDAGVRRDVAATNQWTGVNRVVTKRAPCSAPARPRNLAGLGRDL